MPLGLNAGGYVGDVAVRLYVLGDDACDPDFRASPEQLTKMAGLVEEAMEAGAVGYSISRSLFHRVPDGRNVPGTWAPPEEFYAVAEPLGRLGRGVIESAPRYNEENGSGSRVDEELAWMAELSRRTGRPFSFNLQQIKSLGTHYRDVIRLSEEANETGAHLRPQITPRSVGVLFSLAANTLIDDLPLVPGDQGARPSRSAGRHPRPRPARSLVAEGDAAGGGLWERVYLMPADQPAVYDYSDDDSIASIATAAGVSPVEAYLDAMDRSDGRAIVNWPVMNEDHDAVRELVTSPTTIMGLADAGAHATQIMDASQPTYVLSHWVRDQGALSLEEGVRALSHDTASFVGYADRGTVEVGSYADVNVIDLEALALPLPEIVHDFPGGAPRFVQKATGIDHTFVNGRHFMDHGTHTGELAGRLLRLTEQ